MFLQDSVALLDRSPQSRLELLPLAAGTFQQVEQPGIGKFQRLVFEKLHSLFSTSLAQKLSSPPHSLTDRIRVLRCRAGALQQRLDLLRSRKVSAKVFQESTRVVELLGSGHLPRTSQQLALALFRLLRRESILNNAPDPLELDVARNLSQSVLNRRKRLGSPPRL